MEKGMRFFSVLLVSIFALLLSACQSSNVFTIIIDESYTEFITLGTSADYAPYEWPKNVDGKQTIVGIDIEIAKEIAKAVGKNLKIVNKGFDFLLDDLKNGKLDFVMAAMTPTESRQEIVDFSMIYYEATQVVLMLKEKLETTTSIESLNLSTMRIGAQLGSIQADLAAEYFPLSQKIYLQSVPDLALRLSMGQLDGLLLEKPVAEGYVANKQEYAIAPMVVSEPDGGSAVAVQKGNSALLAQINEVIQQLIASGKMDEIVQTMVLLNS